jgi:hypothetical protein
VHTDQVPDVLIRQLLYNHHDPIVLDQVFGRFEGTVCAYPGFTIDTCRFSVLKILAGLRVTGLTFITVLYCRRILGYFFVAIFAVTLRKKAHAERLSARSAFLVELCVLLR